MFTIRLLKTPIRLLETLVSAKSRRLMSKATNNYVYKIGNFASGAYAFYLYPKYYSRLKEEVRDKKITEAQLKMDLALKTLSALLAGGLGTYMSPYLGGYCLLVSLVGVGWNRGSGSYSLNSE